MEMEMEMLHCKEILCFRIPFIIIIFARDGNQAADKILYYSIASLARRFCFLWLLE